MSKALPSINSQGWGGTLNDHLSQLSDPQTGGFNIVTDIAERNSKFWPDGRTDKDLFVNKTVYVSTTGTFHVWTVQNGLRYWKELQKEINSDSLPGVGTLYGTYDTNLKKHVIKTSNNENFTQFLISNASQLEVTDIGTVSIGEIINNNTVEGSLSYKQESDGQLFNFTINSNLVTTTTTSTLAVGDILIKPGARQYTIIAILSPTSFRIDIINHYENTSVTTFDYIKVVRQSSSKSYSIKNPYISYKSEGKTTLSVRSDGGLFSSKYILSDNYKTGHITSFSGVSKYETTDVVQENITSNLFINSVLVASGIDPGNVYPTSINTYTHRGFDGNPGEWTGTLNNMSGMMLDTGHPSTLDPSTTTNVIDGIFVRVRNESGTVNVCKGIYLSNYLNVGSNVNRMTNIFHPLYIEGAPDAYNPVVWSYIQHSLAINRTDPTAMLEVGGSILATGTITQSSDERLKKDVTKLTGSLDKLSQIRGVRYKWIDPSKHNDDSGDQIGVIAQEIEKVFPEAVREDKEGIKSVSYGDLIAPLIEAIKELKLITESQQREIEELRSKV